ncbi:pyruvate kinase [candidate division KSB1 bacterium]|nr:pyruvate kinase [candidate division KSB1 bacterium]
MNKKQTKIIATISDLRCQPDFIRSLVKNGVNAFRLNTAHQTPQESLEIVQNIRAVTDRAAIMLDTKGPEVRTARIEGKISVKTGDRIEICKIGKGEGCFGVSYDGFIDHVKTGTRILINDGFVALRVVEKTTDSLFCEAENDGQIGNKQSVNVPGVHLNLPTLTDKDIEYVQFACDQDIDFIAHSFVRTKEDVLTIQKMLDERNSRIKILAKIENLEGIKNLDQILEVASGILIARGDLGIEIPAEEVPCVQKEIIQKCLRMGKPCITATQMLHSMVENPRPTRAEVSDVANAVYDGTDAVLLTGETAFGKYPVEAVKTVSGIARHVEQRQPRVRDLPIFQNRNLIRNWLAKSAVSAALELNAKALIIETETGYSARVVSSYGGHIPVYAKTPDMRVVRELSLSYGINPTLMEMAGNTDELVIRALSSLLESGDITPDDLVVILGATPGHNDGANFFEVNTVSTCLYGRR